MSTKNKQEFAKGDLVYIKPITDSSRSHFESDCYAVIVGTYAQLYGGTNVNSYSITRWEDGVSSSWYYEDELELVGEIASEVTGCLEAIRTHKLKIGKLIPLGLAYRRAIDAGII